MSAPLPRPGTFALVLRRTDASAPCVGRLGRLALRPGHYVYVGSAQGPGGVRARLSRHLRQATRPHWHIDYLTAAAEIRLEHR